MKKKVIAGIVVVLVLVIAYWYGGASERMHGFKLSDDNSTAPETMVPGADIAEEEHTEDIHTEEWQADNEHADNDKDNSEPIDTEDNSQEDSKKSEDKETSSAEKKSSPKKAEKKSGNEPVDSKKKVKKKEKLENSGKIQSNISENSAKIPESTPENTEKVATAPSVHSVPASNMPVDNTTAPAQHTCTISISCAEILEHMNMLVKGKEEILPKDGIILEDTTVMIDNKDTVFDVLRKVVKEHSIHLEYSYTPLYKNYYIEGIANIYEFDCGQLSGWMYYVNGKSPNVGCSQYEVEDGDVINFRYTCDYQKE